MQLKYAILLIGICFLLGMNIGIGILLRYLPATTNTTSESLKFKYIDVFEEINEVSHDIDHPTVGELYQNKDTLHIRVKPLNGEYVRR